MIRNAKKEDLERLLEIYAAARAFMRANGNMLQWAGDYPGTTDLLEDIANENLYVLENEDGKVCACFLLAPGVDPTYNKIDGSWKSDTPYAAMHKVASDGTQKGVFSAFVAFARKRYAHLRIDTHHDNLPMQNALLKNGFEYRGIIYLADGDPRKAYEWIK